VSSSPGYFGVEEEGFYKKHATLGKGSHTALIRIDNTGQKLLLIIPKRDILPIGTLLSIMRQGKFTRDEFIEILTG
jgi:predicted RNA binding protein YcfA (HicA-like mRNA interferase family)